MLSKKEFKLCLRPFFKHKPFKLLLLFFISLVSGLTSGFSIILIIPLLQLVTKETPESTNDIAYFINELAGKTNIELNLENILIIYILILSSVAVLNYKKNMISARYHQSLVFTIRQRLFRKIIMSDWKFINNRSKTNYLQVLSQEIPKLSYFYMSVLTLVTSIIIITTYVFWALLVSFKFTAIVVLLGLTLFFSLKKFFSKSLQLGQKNVKFYRTLLKYIDDFWSTVKIAKVHGSEDFYYNKFDKVSSELLQTEYDIYKNHYQPELIYRLIGLMVLVMVIYIGYTFSLLPLQSFFILIILFSRIYPQFTNINTRVNKIINHIPSVKLVLNLDQKFKDPDMKKHAKLEALPLLKQIRLSNISFSYNEEKRIFNGLNLDITARSLVGILGLSGKGKTTLLDIIAGLQPLETGEIKIDGEILDQYNWKRWRNSIGYLPQDSFFIDGTLRENLVWDTKKKIDDDTIIKLLKDLNAIHLVERFPKGLDENIVNYTFHFSGGERQRLALARVLLKKPQILLLDEATSSLDEQNEKQILNLLIKLKSQVTILMVTHNKSLKTYFDKAVDLDNY